MKCMLEKVDAFLQNITECRNLEIQSQLGRGIKSIAKLTLVQFGF